MADCSPITRLFILLRTMRARRYGITVREMAREMEVAEKTIRRDLSQLEHIGFPLLQAGGAHGRKLWRLADTADLPPLTFSYDEAVVLYLGRQFLEPMAGTQFWEAAHSAMSKIKATLTESALRYLDRFPGLFHSTGSGIANYAGKAQIIDDLTLATEDCKSVHLSYRSQQATEPATREVYPYSLVRHWGWLYLVAFAPAHDEVRRYKVDRIEAAELSDSTFERPADFDIAAYLAGSFGIYEGDEDVTVVVKFLPPAARHVLEGSWHGSQALTRQRDGSVLAQFRLSSTVEIKSWVLGFGALAIVVEPESLRAEIAADLGRMLESYRKPRENAASRDDEEGAAAMSVLQPDLIPVRALNQVSYCQRLYYLEYVEAVMPINEFVADGTFQHRRVNDPDLASRTRKEGDALRTRSVSLSSERLGITGKLDLLEEEGDAIHPVETKRSAAPRDEDGRPGFWENDAIQLCAQALLVEEGMGVAVPEGIIYYAGSKARVPVPVDESLRARTLEAISLVRDLAARDTPPAPLPPELRHRCFGCSLAPVCLPEETLYLIQQQDAAPKPPPAEPSTPAPPPIPLPRVIPQNDDKAVLYLHEQGAHVGRRSEHLMINSPAEETQRVPIVSIRQVVVFGNVQVTTQALHGLAEAEIPVAFLSMYGKFIAAVVPAPPKNVALRAAQYKAFSDSARALALARAVVAAKIANQRTLLMRSLRSQARSSVAAGADPEPGKGPEATNPRASDEPAVRDMAEMAARAADAADASVLLGLEGQAAALYFGNFGRMIKAKSPGASFDFTTRNRRPPRDPVNSLLSFAYAILVKDCFSAVCTVGFDPYQGFYHTGRHGRPSLALDLMEEFRPVIADSVVLSLINNGMLKDADFLTWQDACYLTDGGRKTFFEAYEERKATEVTHPVFGYKMSYGRMLEVQARMLSGHVRGDIPRYVGFTVR